MKKANFEGGITLGNKELWVTANVWYTQDHNYGADADGNRGVYMEFLEEVDNVVAIDEVTDRVVQLTEDEMNEICEWIMDNEHKVEFVDECPDYDEDYDDELEDYYAGREWSEQDEY